jgi:two-component system response regulator HydG
MKVLHLEDDEMVATMIKRIFEDKGHEVTHSFSGAQGVNILKKESFDVVICDHDFGALRMKGEDVIKEIRKFSTVPIVANSNSDGGIAKMMLAGASKGLSKSQNAIDIFRAVDEAIRRAKSQ